MTFDPVVQDDRIGAARFASCRAAELGVGDGRHVAGNAVDGDGDELGVGTEPRSAERDDGAARPCRKQEQLRLRSVFGLD